MDIVRFPSFRLTGRRALFSVALAIFWTASVAVIPAAAAQGNVGEHSAAVYCLGPSGELRQLSVGQEVWASPIEHPGVTFIGNQHLQWAAFKVWLAYSSDGVSWQYVANGPWFAAQVGDPVNTLREESWWNFDRQAWEVPQNTNTWYLNWRGFYRVAVQYYWWADEYTGDGSDFAWATTYDDEFSTTTDYCLGTQ